MRAIQESPSQVGLVLEKSPSSKQLATAFNTGMKDPTSVVLNINKRFNKLQAYTTEGSKVNYSMHNTVDSKLRTRNQAPKLMTMSPRTQVQASAVSSISLPTNEE